MLKIKISNFLLNCEIRSVVLEWKYSGLIFLQLTVHIFETNFPVMCCASKRK